MHLGLSVFIAVVPPHRREDRARPALRLHHRDGREREPRHRGLLSAPAQVGDTLAQPGDRCEIRDLLTIKYHAHVSPDVTPYQFSPDKHYLSSIVLEVDFFNKKNTTTDPFNSDDMAKEFSMQFCKQVRLITIPRRDLQVRIARPSQWECSACSTLRIRSFSPSMSK